MNFTNFTWPVLEKFARYKKEYLLATLHEKLLKKVLLNDLLNNSNLNDLNKEYSEP